MTESKTISILFELGEQTRLQRPVLEAALDNLFSQIDAAYSQGYNIIILSDRGVDKTHAAIPAILAVSAVEQYLIRTKKRTSISIILETAEVRDVHQAAMCLGYGARAVNPYLAHEAIAELIDQKILDKDYHTAIDDYNKALINGIVKIAATKVSAGVSTGIGDHESKYTGKKTDSAEGDEQFEINDSRSFDQMYEDMSGEGLQPVLNDYLYV